jgi:hypothetical protein
MKFSVPADIDIRAKRFTSSEFQKNFVVQPCQYHNYNFTDLARDVSFCLKFIDSIPNDKPIGIIYGQLTYLHIAFKLALVKSRRPYILFTNSDTDDIRPDLSEYCSRIIILGQWENKFFEIRKRTEGEQGTYKFDDFYVDTNTWEFQNLAESHNEFDDLVIEFSDEQKVYYQNAQQGKTDLPYIGYNTSRVEASSIQTAMKHYVEEDDVCVHYRPFKHFGVGTLIIYPAFFKAKRHVICTTLYDWGIESSVGTNIHLAYQMVTSRLTLPKSTRIITTGGYNFDDACIKYVTDQCNPEKIIDCFGLSVCPPPLAIRSVKIGEKVPFEWVNDFMKFKISTDNHLKIIGEPGIFKDVMFSKAGNVLQTNDYVLSGGENKFYFLGNASLKVRVDHRLEDKVVFLDMLSDYLLKENLPREMKLTFVDKNGVPSPILTVSPQARAYVRKLLDKLQAEIELE